MRIPGQCQWRAGNTKAQPKVVNMQKNGYTKKTNLLYRTTLSPRPKRFHIVLAIQQLRRPLESIQQRTRPTRLIIFPHLRTCCKYILRDLNKDLKYSKLKSTPSKILGSLESLLGEMNGCWFQNSFANSSLVKSPS